jgi:hypothetical protein
MKQMFVVLVLVICCLVPVGVSPQSSANYRIVGGDLNSGGQTNMSSTIYHTSATLGQSSPIGASNSTSYQTQIGIQYIYHTQAVSKSYLLWTK